MDRSAGFVRLCAQLLKKRLKVAVDLFNEKPKKGLAHLQVTLRPSRLPPRPASGATSACRRRWAAAWPKSRGAARVRPQRGPLAQWAVHAPVRPAQALQLLPDPLEPEPVAQFLRRTKRLDKTKARTAARAHRQGTLRRGATRCCNEDRRVATLRTVSSKRCNSEHRVAMSFT